MPRNSKLFLPLTTETLLNSTHTQIGLPFLTHFAQTPEWAHTIAYVSTVDRDGVVLAVRSFEALGLSETITLTLLTVHKHDFAL